MQNRFRSVFGAASGFAAATPRARVVGAGVVLSETQRVRRTAGAGPDPRIAADRRTPEML